MKIIAPVTPKKFTITRGRLQEYEDVDTRKRYWSISEGLFVLDPEAFKGVDPHVMAAAQTRGTNLHVLFGLRLLAEIGLAEKPARPAGIIGNYFDAIEKFIYEKQPRALKVEQPSCNDSLHLAGTPDTQCLIGLDNWIIDLKTGDKRAVHSSQLHAQKKLDGYEKARRLGSLYINRKGDYKLVEHTTDVIDWGGFMGALAVLQWRKQRG